MFDVFSFHDFSLLIQFVVLVAEAGFEPANSF